MFGFKSVLYIIAITAGGFFSTLSASPMLQPAEQESVAIFAPDYAQTLRTRTAVSGKPKKHRDEAVQILPVKFAWRDTASNGPYTLEISLDKAFSQPVTVKSFSMQVEVCNLFSAKQYFCRVLDKDNRIVASGSFRTAAQPRWISFPDRGFAPVNFRDLGYRKTVSGLQVRQGMVYRGADLELWRKPSRKNFDFIVNDLKIKSEIDMRYPRQVADKSNSRLGKGVKLFFRPINAYNSFTPEQCALFRDTIRIFADEKNYPLYFHCSGGVDRTGEIAFLLNGLLGVPEEQLLEDYELSSLSLFPRHRNIDYFKSWREKIATYAPAGSPVQVQIESYLLAIGVTAEEISAIKRIMLE